MSCHVCAIFFSGGTDGDSRVGGDQQCGLLSVRVLQNRPGSGGPTQVNLASTLCDDSILFYKVGHCNCRLVMLLLSG